MSFEHFESSPRKEAVHESARLAEHFKELVITEHVEEHLYSELESDLLAEGFQIAPTEEVQGILDSNTLLCRSESFSRVIDLLLEQKTIELKNHDGRPNMCNVTGGKGFKVAMQEGLSGKDVGGAVKVVLTFTGAHLDTRSPVSPQSELWETKPDTAEVSLTGTGEIETDDVAMVSFRFPIHLFPESFLTDDERDLLEDANIKFVVRHYNKRQEKTTH